jgi:hypothetical protein
MAGFRSVKKYTDAWEAGRSFTSHFRKSIVFSNSGSRWFDLSTVAGGPVANFYASNPLEAATLNGSRGIYHGESKTPATKWLTAWSATCNTAVLPQLFLLDYLLYYPFIDGDDVSAQALTNDVTLPRYADGDGVKVMAVCVATATGSGRFTFDYINEQGASKTSPTQFCVGSGTPPIVGQLLSVPSAGSTQATLPFCELAAGDRGVRSITSVTWTTPNSGLMCLVLVKPLALLNIREVSVQSEQEFITTASGPIKILDGAYLNLAGYGTGSLSGTGVVGTLSTIWDEGT